MQHRRRPAVGIRCQQGLAAGTKLSSLSPVIQAVSQHAISSLSAACLVGGHLCHVAQPGAHAGLVAQAAGRAHPRLQRLQHVWGDIHSQDVPDAPRLRGGARQHNCEETAPQAQRRLGHAIQSLLPCSAMQPAGLTCRWGMSAPSPAPASSTRLAADRLGMPAATRASLASTSGVIEARSCFTSALSKYCACSAACCCCCSGAPPGGGGAPADAAIARRPAAAAGAGGGGSEVSLQRCRARWPCAHRLPGVRACRQAVAAAIRIGGVKPGGELFRERRELLDDQLQRSTFQKARCKRAFKAETSAPGVFS